MLGFTKVVNTMVHLLSDFKEEDGKGTKFEMGQRISLSNIRSERIFTQLLLNVKSVR